MSQKDLARRTAVEIAFAGVNITSSIAPYLLSVTYTDNEEDETDDLQIKLQDRDGIWMESWLDAAIDAAAAGAVATPSGSTSGGGGTSYIVTATGTLPVRTGPGVQYEQIGGLAPGAAVSVIEKDNKATWAKIRYNGKVAYVSAKYIGTPKTSKSSSGSSKTTSKSSTKKSSGQTGGAAVGEYTVVKGDSLWAIAKKFLGNGQRWTEIRDLNGIKGTLIYPGQKLKIPGMAAETEETVTGSSGMKIQAVMLRQNWNGDGKDKALDCGQFELDTVQAAGPPATITIKATSLPYTSRVRQTEKSRVWEGIKLSAIIKQIATENGMTCLYEADTDPSYDRVEQYKTSDIAFASGLCHDAGISLKATNNIIVAFDQAAYEAKPAARTIRRGDGSYTKYKMSVGSTDTKYATCRVKYTVPGTGKVIQGIAYAEDYKKDDKNNQQLEVTAKVASVGEAEKLAAKRLRLHNKYEKSVTFDLPGDPDLVAGVTVMVEGFGAWNGKYIIRQAKHTVGSSGYVTQISLRRVLEGY